MVSIQKTQKKLKPIKTKLLAQAPAKDQIFGNNQNYTEHKTIENFAYNFAYPFPLIAQFKSQTNQTTTKKKKGKKKKSKVNERNHVKPYLKDIFYYIQGMESK